MVERMTVAQLRRLQGVGKPAPKKKRNPDPAPTIPPSLVRGFASDGLLEDDLLMCEIEIAPPSVNNYWIKGKNKTNRLSLRAKHFTAVMQRFIRPFYYEDAVAVNIAYAPPDNIKRDIDNIVKPIFDSLSKCGLIIDDKQVNELVVKRLPVQKNGKLIIHVKKLGE